MRIENHKEKRIEVEGRTFLIEFWDDCTWHIPLHYVCVSEIVLVTKRWWGATKTREVKREIDKGWGAKNRVEWAMDCIASHLQYEKAVIDDCQRVEDFCKDTRTTNKDCNPPLSDEAVARQEQACKDIEKAKEKLFGKKQTDGRGLRAKISVLDDAFFPQDTPHWIIEDKGFGGMYIECSECGATWCDLFDKKIPWTDDLCPVCGAQMDEDAEEYI